MDRSQSKVKCPACKAGFFAAICDVCKGHHVVEPEDAAAHILEHLDDSAGWPLTTQDIRFAVKTLEASTAKPPRGQYHVALSPSAHAMLRDTKSS